MSSRPIYLDNAATTAADPPVIAAMNSCLGADGDFANPSSASHVYGRQAGARVEQARAEVAALVNAAPEQVLFTSGATEANNLALLGAACGDYGGGGGGGAPGPGPAPGPSPTPSASDAAMQAAFGLTAQRYHAMTGHVDVVLC